MKSVGGVIREEHALRIAMGITMLALMLAGGAGAATLTVNASGGADYASIQGAIDNATAGDTIEVHSGTYYENVNVNKQLILRGIGMPVVGAGGNDSAITVSTDGVTLEGFNASNSNNAGITVKSNNSIIIGNNAGIQVIPSSSPNKQYGNNITDNSAAYITLSVSRNNNITNNTVNGGIQIAFESNDNSFKGNTIDGSINIFFMSSGNSFEDNIVNGGISMEESGNNYFNGNTINGNISLWRSSASINNNIIDSGNITISRSSSADIIGNIFNSGGIILSSVNHATANIINNTINSDDIGILSIGGYLGGNEVLITGNTINSKGIGIKGYGSGNIFNNYINAKTNYESVAYNIDTLFTWNITKQSGTNIIGGPYLGGNFWANPSGTGFSQTCADVNSDGICDSSYSLDNNNTDYLPLASIPAAGHVHNINKNKNYTTIQAAINDASPGDEIHVDNGTYYENVNVNKRLILRGIGMPVVEDIGGGSAITLAADGIMLEGFTARAGLEGINITSNNNTLISNNANENAAFGIYMKYSSNNTLIDNNVNENTGFGIYLEYSTNNTLIGNNANENIGHNYGVGIFLVISSNNTLIDNNAKANVQGIRLDSSSNNKLIGNNASSNIGWYCDCLSAKGPGVGITLVDSSNNNTLIGNYVNSNYAIVRPGIGMSDYSVGIYLDSSGNNTLSGNTVNSNTYNGISLNSSSNNLIYNNIFNNTNNAQINGSIINTWNTTKQSDTNILGGSYLGGNFWANPNGTGFSQTCADVNSDGICDSAYSLDNKNTDYLPLASSESPMLVISNIASISGKVYGQDTLAIGKLLYIDRNYKFAGVPPSYAGLNYIKTSTDDRYRTESNFLQFDVNKDVTVYVAYDDRISPKPSWLTSFFTDTGDNLVRDDSSTFSIYSRNYPAGHISLGGTSIRSGGAGGSYVVIVKPQGSPLPSTLTVSISESPDPVMSGGTSQVTVHVTSGGSNVAGANVGLSSTGGSLSSITGATDANGNFTVTYTAPSVTASTTHTISSTASKTGFVSGSGSDLITVNPVPSGLRITNIVAASGKTYIKDTLAIGKLFYIDRNYKFAGVPPSFTGLNYIKTSTDDRYRTESNFLQFDVNKDVTVYVAYDDRISPKPSWLTSFFTDTGDNLVRDDSSTFSIYSRNYPAGHISLGGTSIRSSGAGGSYVVIVKPQEPPLPSTLVTNIVAASGKTYIKDTLAIGKLFYIDRNYKLSSVPPSYTGLNYIKTSTDDRYRTESNFLQFDVNKDVTVYIAYDDRISPKPSWLTSFFTDTGDNLVRDDSSTFSIYSRNYPAGHISLGGTSIRSGGAGGSYVVIVKPQESPLPSTLVTNIVAASGKKYVNDTLAIGKLFYIDRNYKLSSVPPSYTGLNYIKTSTDDRYRTESNFLQFDVNKDVTVYVAYDDRISPKPSWLTSFFTDTGDNLVRDDSSKFSIYSRNYPAGHVSLGGTSIPSGGAGGSYVVILK